jgi:RHS repeat-associated protein
MYHITGLGYATNTITVNGATAYRKGEYFRQQLGVLNGSAAVWTNITVTEANVATNTGNLFVARTPEAFTYDADGNLLSDGRWNYFWDAENRLVGMTANNTKPAVGPQISLVFQYDWKGRRILKQVWSSPGWQGALTNSTASVYDGWNLVAELNTLNAPSAPTLYRSYLWGLDLSGSEQGAGGVGGLLEINDPTNGVHFAAYDGNGNVAGLVSASSGASSAVYEYDPFGEVNRATGQMAGANPLRFSTKYQDRQTDLVYYGYRYYKASTGRWLSRDPILERGGNNLYAMSRNAPISLVDPRGHGVLSILDTVTTCASVVISAVFKDVLNLDSACSAAAAYSATHPDACLWCGYDFYSDKALAYDPVSLADQFKACILDLIKDRLPDQLLEEITSQIERTLLSHLLELSDDGNEKINARIFIHARYHCPAKRPYVIAALELDLTDPEGHSMRLEGKIIADGYCPLIWELTTPLEGDPSGCTCTCGKGYPGPSGRAQ